MSNIDKKTVEGFGQEWEAYDQKNFNGPGYEFLCSRYFKLFPFNKIDNSSEGFDMGCGSGRWAKYIAPKVGKLNCIDPSERALQVAKENLINQSNCFFECSGINETKLKKGSQDFGYSLGVLHHIPDVQMGIQACSELLKPGSPFILYLYYRFDDKPFWFRIIWRLSDLLRRVICLLPFRIKKVLCLFIAVIIYLPLAKLAKLVEWVGLNSSNIPLSSYKNQPFYTMATDSLDRFGTRLEHRFLKSEIITMMENAGFKDIEFDDPNPGWICVGYKS